MFGVIMSWAMVQSGGRLWISDFSLLTKIGNATNALLLASPDKTCVAITHDGSNALQFTPS